MGVTYLTCFFFIDFSADLSALSLPAIRDLVTSVVHWIWLAVISICMKGVDFTTCTSTHMYTDMYH